MRQSLEKLKDMNLEEIRNTIIKSAQLKLQRHKHLGSQSSLSISQVAELHDIVNGMADSARITPDHLIGRISLN